MTEVAQGTPFAAAAEAVAAGTEPEEAAAKLVASMTPDEKLWCLDGDSPTWAGLKFMATGGYHRLPFEAAVVDRLGIPGFAFSDGPRGVVIGNATCFPVTMARGATWDPELEERIGDAIGKELRASGATLYGGVCVNILRHPAWGRAQETYGEDPHHVGELGAALTRGIQRHAMACVKHFACNSMENARFTVDIDVDEIALHEVYLAHFKRIVDEGVASVMSAYNMVNGDYCGENRALLTGVLRDEWDFRGYVISDWIMGMRDAAKSVTAGLDVEMPSRMVRFAHLPGALERGEASWEDVDRSVTHILATLLRFHPILSADRPPMSVIASDDHRSLARTAAARSVLLLRNEGVEGAAVLPLDTHATGSIAVIGRLADAVNLGDGGSSDVWALDAVTVLDGLRATAPDVDVRHDAGADPAAAVALAAAADVAVVVVGYTHEDEGEYIGDVGIDTSTHFPAADEPDVVERYERFIADPLPATMPPHVAARPSSFSHGGDRTSLRLPPEDVALINAVAAANPRTVVVIQAGSAVVMSEWDRSVPAIVQAWYGGAEAGTGLADVIFGVENPSARLPFSVPVDESDLPTFDRDATSFVYDRWHGWWHLERTGTPAAYPFGFGLSYTTFELGPFSAHVGETGFVVAGSVANTGTRDGADVVQVYAELADPGSPPRLVGFARLEVGAGSSSEARVDIPFDRFAHRDVELHAMVVAPGACRLTVGRYAGDPSAQTLEAVLPGGS